MRPVTIIKERNENDEDQKSVDVPSAKITSNVTVFLCGFGVSGSMIMILAD
jgi:hypothetical protein